MAFLNYPNLPINKVTDVAVNGRELDVIEGLKNLGITVYPISESDFIENKISSHADMNILYLGNGKYLGYEEILPKEFTFVPESTPEKPNYEKSTKLNCALIGKYCIYNPKTASKNIPFDNYTLISVNQGYSKCSVLVIDEESIITADNGIAEMSKKTGLNVLTVNQTEVSLKGYPNGFIGGIGGKLEKSILGIAGEIKYLSNNKEIIHFCRNCGVYIERICGGKIKDIGGIIPLKETDY